jgi:hypothetical protein
MGDTLMITFKTTLRREGWQTATMSERRATNVSDTTVAQLMCVEMGSSCQCCKLEPARIVRRGLRWCLFCARHDAIVQRQVRAARTEE